MAKKTSGARIDLFVVADAVLISLACVLIFLAYREIKAAPVRHAQNLAHTLMMVSNDFHRENPLEGLRLGDDGLFELAQRVNHERERLEEVQPGSQLEIYSTHPNYARISEAGDAFLDGALEQAKSGDIGYFEQLEKTGAGYIIRAAAPLRAEKDCADCTEIGAPDYKRGDVIGLREVRMPVSDEYARTIGKLLYAFAVLAAALTCVLGIIFPTIKKVRAERATMNDRAVSLELQASTDPLTGLFNRRYFEKELSRHLEEFTAAGSSLGLLIFDLDHFKQINDTYGHDTGDVVLKEVALRLKAITRENDVVARIGGEEFAVITPYVGQDQLLAVAERYRNMIGSLKVDIGSVILRPTISVGVATSADGVTDWQDLFKAADQKLYAAKRSGRNRVAA